MIYPRPRGEATRENWAEDTAQVARTGGREDTRPGAVVFSRSGVGLSARRPTVATPPPRRSPHPAPTFGERVVGIPTRIHIPGRCQSGRTPRQTARLPMTCSARLARLGRARPGAAAARPAGAPPGRAIIVVFLVRLLRVYLVLVRSLACFSKLSDE